MRSRIDRHNDSTPPTVYSLSIDIREMIIESTCLMSNRPRAEQLEISIYYYRNNAEFREFVDRLTSALTDISIKFKDDWVKFTLTEEVVPTGNHQTHLATPPIS